MRWLTEDAVLVCDHESGRVDNGPSQDLVTVNGRRVMVGPNLLELKPGDTELRQIRGCANSIPPIGIKPCLLTLPVESGYSDFIRIEGRALCLDTVTGHTDGTPPATVKYHVRVPGQDFVTASS